MVTCRKFSWKQNGWAIATSRSPWWLDHPHQQRCNRHMWDMSHFQLHLGDRNAWPMRMDFWRIFGVPTWSLPKEFHENDAKEVLLDLDSLGRVLSLSRNRAFQNHVVLNVVSSPTPFILIMVPFSRQTQLVGAEQKQIQRRRCRRLCLDGEKEVWSWARMPPRERWCILKEKWWG